MDDLFRIQTESPSTYSSSDSSSDSDVSSASEGDKAIKVAPSS